MLSLLVIEFPFSCSTASDSNLVCDSSGCEMVGLLLMTRRLVFVLFAGLLRQRNWALTDSSEGFEAAHAQEVYTQYACTHNVDTNSCTYIAL